MPGTMPGNQDAEMEKKKKKDAEMKKENTILASRSLQLQYGDYGVNQHYNTMY